MASFDIAKLRSSQRPADHVTRLRGFGVLRSKLALPNTACDDVPGLVLHSVPALAPFSLANNQLIAAALSAANTRVFLALHGGVHGLVAGRESKDHANHGLERDD